MVVGAPQFEEADKSADVRGKVLLSTGEAAKCIPPEKAQYQLKCTPYVEYVCHQTAHSSSEPKPEYHHQTPLTLLVIVPCRSKFTA